MVNNNLSKPTDYVLPVVTAFVVPETSDTLTISIVEFTAEAYGGVTGFLITESEMPPSPYVGNWASRAPEFYTLSAEGQRTLYAWVRDAFYELSPPMTARTNVALPKKEEERKKREEEKKEEEEERKRVPKPPKLKPPRVTSFTLPSTFTSLAVPILGLSAIGEYPIIGRIITETAAAPPWYSLEWRFAAPALWVFDSEGSKTLYAFVKDSVGQVSAGMSARVNITLPKETPEEKKKREEEERKKKEKPKVPKELVLPRIPYPKWWKDSLNATIGFNAPGSATLATVSGKLSLFVATIVITVTAATEITITFGSSGKSGKISLGDEGQPMGIVIAMGNSPAPCGHGNLVISATDPYGNAAYIGGFATCFVTQDKE